MILTIQIVNWSLMTMCLGNVVEEDILRHIFQVHLIHHETLDEEGKFQISWGPGQPKIMFFMVEVETLGYVAFGLSQNGSMAGSDVVTAWVKDGEDYYQDRYADGNWMPRIDASQDWKLEWGNENDTHTTFIFRRKLDTCDEDDVVIDSRQMTLIYAYSDEDPTDVNNIPYHFGRRGSVVLQTSPKPIIDFETTKIWEVFAPNYAISSSQSNIQWCKIVKIPQLDEKNHVVLIDPMIDKSNEDYVSHMSMYECLGGDPEEYEELVNLDGHECPHPDMPRVMLNCEMIYSSWEKGKEGTLLPVNVGIPLHSSFALYYMLKVQYNSQYKPGEINTPFGFRIFYTPNLRTFDAGMLKIGAYSKGLNFVPPGRTSYTIAAHANAECMARVVSQYGIKMFAVSQHAHNSAYSVKMRFFLHGKEIPLTKDAEYDNNLQDYHYLEEHAYYSLDDHISVECSYDSSNLTTSTVEDYESMDEMCAVTLLYYPRIDVSKMLSAPSEELVAKLIGSSEIANLIRKETHKEKLVEYVKDFNWNKTDVSLMEKELRYSDQKTYCFFSNGSRMPIQSLISYPKDIVEYVKKPQGCGKETADKKKEQIASGGRSGRPRIMEFFSFYVVLGGLLIIIL